MTAGVVVSGVGFSHDLGPRTGRSEGELALQACRAALADAALEPKDLDGLSMFPFRGTPPDPFDGPGLLDVARALGMARVRWHQAYTTENGQLGAVLGTIDALAAGRCRHAVCYRAHIARRRATFDADVPATRYAYDEDAHTAPYGGGTGSARGGLWAARYMAVHVVTQQQLGSVSVNNRAHGAHNPLSYFKTPVTMDEYLASRWIATPLKLLDVDYPIDGATAILLSRADAARGTRHPVLVEASGYGPGITAGWLTWPEKAEMGSTYASQELWKHTKLRPRDVDVAEVYDGFSFFTLQWLEALGLVPAGAAGAWLLEGGGRLDGALPVNTDGGQLSMGRLHGFGKVVQATRQVRGEAVNQVHGAEVAVAGVGGGVNTSVVLLRRYERT